MAGPSRSAVVVEEGERRRGQWNRQVWFDVGGGHQDQASGGARGGVADPMTTKP
jgi:hypothetical protein